MNKKELNVWAYLNEIEYILKNENNNKHALELISIARDILTGEMRGDFDDLED
ncbi:hypothetical protein LDQ61_001750 [Listeria monocytogenes]|nr:hypothetical protein [Listeria monocytogenes]HDT8170395.1 hypothetical protein [Enterococcus faecalis]